VVDIRMLNEPEIARVWFTIECLTDRNALAISQIFKTMNKIYPVIQVPANGKPDWYTGARTLCFVYSKHHGNFILEGYRGEVMEFLKKNCTHYFYYVSMWHNGKARGHWGFWRNYITIAEPDKRVPKYRKPEHKYRIFTRPDGYSNSIEVMKLKRLPKRWIPDFDDL
jgi:hypothetical protein